jgi:hypothetical protein
MDEGRMTHQALRTSEGCGVCVEDVVFALRSFRSDAFCLMPLVNLAAKPGNVVSSGRENVQAGILLTDAFGLASCP